MEKLAHSEALRLIGFVMEAARKENPQEIALAIWSKGEIVEVRFPYGEFDLKILKKLQRGLNQKLKSLSIDEDDEKIVYFGFTKTSGNIDEYLRKALERAVRGKIIKGYF